MSYQETFPDLVDAIARLNEVIEEVGNYADEEAWDTVRGELHRRGAALAGIAAANPAVSACSHGPDKRCIDCATDDELRAAIPPFPGERR